MDRLSEFKDKMLSQGRVLSTPTTRRWSKEEWDRVDKQERKALFYNFSGMDHGRGREIVFVAESETEALEVLEKHNKRAEEIQKEKSK